MKNKQLIAQLAAFPSQLEQLLDELTPAQLTALPLADEWSVAQNVHHLADAHMNGFIRTKLALTEDRPTFKPYDEALWAALADANQADFAASLAILRGIHVRWVQLLHSLDDAQWEQAGLHPTSGQEQSVTTLLESYIRHGNAHLDQMRRTLAAQP